MDADAARHRRRESCRATVIVTPHMSPWPRMRSRSWVFVSASPPPGHAICGNRLLVGCNDGLQHLAVTNTGRRKEAGRRNRTRRRKKEKEEARSTKQAAVAKTVWSNCRQATALQRVRLQLATTSAPVPLHPLARGP